MFASKIYTHSPVWAQESMIAAREFLRAAIREKRRFETVLHEINRSQWLDPERLLELQERQALAVFQHAARNVPYYTELFQRHRIGTEDIRSIEDFQRIPLLTKADILRNPRAFVANNIRGPRFRIQSSGSTGTPLTLVQSFDAINRENAFVRRLLTWAGLNRSDRCAWLRGDMIVPIGQKDPPFWRMNHANNMLMMSSYHLSEGNAEYYIAALESFDPMLIQSYPTSAAFLASYLESRGRNYRGRNLRAVVTSSETLRIDQKSTIERWLGCRVFDYYGGVERVAQIGTCEKGKLHIMADYGYAELLPGDDGTAEIVGTGFNNWLMPLLRYRTNDKVVISVDEGPCTCGRSFPLVKQIEGRMDDYILTADGRKITRLGHVFAGINNIAEAQIVQERIGEVCISVVPLGHFGEEGKARLRNQAEQRLGEDMRIKIRIASQIERGRTGKLQVVVRRMNQV